ncbi:MAG: hypothetical protein ABI652_04785 [Acidobacteriota bacterium]
MPLREVEEPSGRETRLVVLVVVVALAVLLLLARFRFPSADLTVVVPAPGPLAGLAARATFDEMASAMAGLADRVEPSIAVLDIEPVPPLEHAAAGRGAAPVSPRGAPRSPAVSPTPTPPPPMPRRPHVVAALRIRSDLVVAYVGAGMRVATKEGEPAAEVIALSADPAIVILRAFAPAVSIAATVEGFAGFSYAGVVDVTPGGPTVQPTFVGRADRVEVVGWSRSLISLGRSDIPAGTFVFSIDGRLIGLAIRSGDSVSLVPASALIAAVADVPPKVAGPPTP